MEDTENHLSEYQTGCKYWAYCENCPYPECRYANSWASFIKAIRGILIRDAIKRFPSVALIALAMKVGKSTVYRALKEGGNENTREP